MKTHLLYAACFMSAVAFTACDNEMEEAYAPQEHLTVEAGISLETRTSLKDDNSTVVWSEGDEIYLFGGTSKAKMKLDKGIGETRGEFVGNVEGKVSDLKNALYPVPGVKDGKYTFELPAERSYSENSAAPMIGTLEKNHVTFENLMALVRIPLESLKAQENVVKLTMLGGSIAGTATVDVNAKTLTMEGTQNEVTVTIPSGVAECNVDIPVPAGTYTGYIVTLNNTYKYYQASNEQTLTNNQVLIADNTKADANVAVVATAADLATAVSKNGKTNIILAPGEYDVYGCGGKTLTINGTKDVVLTLKNEGEDGCDYGFGDSGGVGNHTLNGITVNTTSNTGNFKGYAYMKGSFNDCSFVGSYSLNNENDFIFNRCDFDFKDGYFWTWSAKTVMFNECNFNGNSKAILAHGGVTQIININNCRFNAKEKGFTYDRIWTAAVEIDPTNTNTYTINFTGVNTKTEFYSSWTRIKDGSTGHVIKGI